MPEDSSRHIPMRGREAEPSPARGSAEADRQDGVPLYEMDAGSRITLTLLSALSGTDVYFLLLPFSCPFRWLA